MVGKLNIYLRLKPSSSSADTSYYRINSPNEIQLLVPPNNREPYHFTEIFSEENDFCIRSLTRQCVDSSLLGTNSSVICLGTKDSGKTDTIFGSNCEKDFKQSLCYSIVNGIFESIRNTPNEKNCSITVNFIEIDKDCVRDLGMAYYKKDEMRLSEVLEVLAQQDLEIKEAAGKTYVQDACILRIISSEEIFEIVNLGFKARELMQSQGDLIFCINLSQKIKNGVQSARIYLVDLNNTSFANASEDSVMEVIKKVLNKINLTNLLVPVKNIPFKNNKITYLLQNSLLNSTVCVVSHIDSDPLKFKDSYETLNYTKKITEIDKKLKLTMMERPNSKGTADWARRLKEEIDDLDLSIKKSQSLYEEKLRNFAKLIGIEEDLEVLLVAEKGSKEYEFCRKYREAMQSVKNLTQRNNELELKAENFKKIMNDLQMVHSNNIEKNKRKIHELKDEIRSAKDKLEVYEELKEKTMAEKVLAKTENLEKMLYKSHFLLEEKSALIQTLKVQMGNNSSDLKNILDIKELGKTEVETDLKMMLTEKESGHNSRIKSLQNEFNGKIKKKDEEIMKNSMEYGKKLREMDTFYKELEDEAVKLFEVARLQGKAIYDIEQGKYNKGISPVLIPRVLIPQIPSENKFPLIFAALGSQALEVARISNKVKNRFSYVPNKTINSSQKSTFFRETDKSYTEPNTSVSVLLSSSLNNIRITELRNIGNSLQQIIKNNSKDIVEIQKSQKEKEVQIEELKQELENVVSEKNKFKEMYAVEVRKRIDEADKNEEKLQGKAFITELMTRPNTQRNIETTNKMMRNIHTTVSGHRILMSTSPSVKLELIRPSTTNYGNYAKKKYG